MSSDCLVIPTRFASRPRTTVASEDWKTFARMTGSTQKRRVRRRRSTCIFSRSAPTRTRRSGRQPPFSKPGRFANIVSPRVWKYAIAYTGCSTAAEYEVIAKQSPFRRASKSKSRPTCSAARLENPTCRSPLYIQYVGVRAKTAVLTNKTRFCASRTIIVAAIR